MRPGLTLLLLATVACAPNRTPPEGPELAAPGSACAKDADCETGYCMTQGISGFPGGYCTADCAAAACATGTCTSWGDLTVCLYPCADRTECRDGYQCLDSTCRPLCRGDSCGAGHQCVDGQCEELQLSPAGAPCTANAECEGGLCLPTARVCSQPCGRSADCAAGLVCGLDAYSSGSGPADRFAQGCVAAPGTTPVGGACTADAECQSAICHFNLCVTPCVDAADCDPGTVCADHLRVLPGDWPVFRVCLPSAGTLFQDLGESSAVLGLPIPSNAVSFSIVDTVTGAGLWTGVESLSTPNMGTDLYYQVATIDDFYNKLPIRYFPASEASEMLVPNTPRVSLQAGLYILENGSYALDAQGNLQRAAEKPHVRLYIKLGDPAAPPSHGTLGLNFYFLDLSGMSCARARLNATNAQAGDFQRTVSTIRSVYNQAGITLGTITYQDVSGHPELSTIDTSGGDSGTSEQLDQLLRLSAGQTNPGVNVFVVASLTPDGILGIAGGIPGVHLHGTAHSGLAVGAETLCYAQFEFLGEVVAHEAGHTLGLFHNQEQDGHTDPIDDTGTSDSNLMYWVANGGTTLTTGQRFVLLRSTQVL
ncbi:MAG: hypothetical protein HY906_22555 [Deltaproteobacteria bacterium]|nr:hypothetical protein [Deltaproteobacteria bacterium]